MNSCLTLIFWLQVYFDNLLLRKLQIFFLEIIVILIGIKYLEWNIY